MKKKLIGGVGIAALVAAVGFGSMAIAGDGDERDAARVVTAEPITATERGAVTRAGNGGTIQTFYLSNVVVPDVNEGVVTGVRCPAKAGSAIDGGASTAGGIVVGYLSQLRPGNGNRLDRVYWVGVDDNSTTNSDQAGAILEVHCAKGIKVRK